MTSEPLPPLRSLAVLLVNGRTGHGERSWMEICLPRLLNAASGLLPLKVFVWNHDFENETVVNLLQTDPDRVVLMDERDPAFAGYDGPRYPARSVLAFHEFHVHRTPLQLLFEKAQREFRPDAIYVCDSDAWPVRPYWDLRMLSSLNAGNLLAGVWRDEMASVIEPFIHPSGMAFPASLVEALNLRLDYKPEDVGEDTLSNFTRAVVAARGDAAIEAFDRSNAEDFHGVFGGVYGDWIYHHHLGTRWADGKATIVKTKGWEDRKEDLDENYALMARITRDVFDRTDGFIAELRFGETGSERAAIPLDKPPLSTTAEGVEHVLAKVQQLIDTDPQAAITELDRLGVSANRNPAYFSAQVKLAQKRGLEGDVRAYQLGLDLLGEQSQR